MKCHRFVGSRCKIWKRYLEIVAITYLLKICIITSSGKCAVFLDFGTNLQSPNFVVSLISFGKATPRTKSYKPGLKSFNARAGSVNKSTLISFSSVFYTKVTLALLLFSGWQTNMNLLLYRQNLRSR
jgi:hypothetical protein